jgi:lipoprotein-anchoring transpeptidase ErfK/SrfK
MAKRPQQNLVSSAHADRAAQGERARDSVRGAPAALGLFVGVVGASAMVLRFPEGCTHMPPPGAEPESLVERAGPHAFGTERGDAGLESRDPPSPAASAGLLSPGEVALVGSMVTTAPIYSGMEALREKRIGYIRLGSKAPAYAAPIKAGSCEMGWYHLLGGGFVCAKFATLDLNHPLVRLGTAPPNFDDLLPYRYVRNVTTGTPVYRSVPSRQQMLQSEPYLMKPQPRPAPREEPADPVDDGDNPYVTVATPAAEPAPRPWQGELDFGKDVKLSDLVESPDSIIARRLVKGFYIAADKEFSWNNRTWLKTTAGFVAPADRFAPATPSSLRGIELASTDPTEAAAFVLSSQAFKYQVDADKRQVVATGSVERFTPARLTGRIAELATGVFRETADGWWMKASDGTYTEPGPPPGGLAEGEKWIDVNLSRQTLVAFEGGTPVYATLIASGRRASDPNDKLHDHRTIQGAFRVREKHVTITMDGDGPAPGDMPYSIDDVPYVMYFEGSYALHGAFWHANFGHETSHGCVNLAPLDAKRLFFWSNPPLPEGWHGVIATEENPGSRIVVHE